MDAEWMTAPRSSASQHVGHLVQQLREKAGLPRKRLGERAGVDLSNLARIENGQGNPTLFVLIQLATALQVDPAVFVEGLTAKDLPEDIKPYSEADFRRHLRESGRA